MNAFSGKVKVLGVPSLPSSSPASSAAWLGWVGRYMPPGMLMMMTCFFSKTALRISARERSHPKNEGESRKMQMRHSSRSPSPSSLASAPYLARFSTTWLGLGLG